MSDGCVEMQTLYENDASIHILYHKVEALVDGYLDTSTPPWIKVGGHPRVPTSDWVLVGSTGNMEMHVRVVMRLLYTCVLYTCQIDFCVFRNCHFGSISSGRSLSFQNSISCGSVNGSI